MQNKLTDTMKCRSLAIFSPIIGARSETFIKRHAKDLLPGRTIVIGKHAGLEADWSTKSPFLDHDYTDSSRSLFGSRSLSRVLTLMSAGRLEPVRRFLRRHKVEVLLGEYLDASLVLLPIARELDVRLFVHAHGYDVSEMLRYEFWRKKYLEYDSAAGIITMSHISRQRLIEIGLSPEKIYVIPYGVIVPSKAPYRPRRDSVRCIAVGRMVEKKGPILLLDAFRRAADVVPKLRLDFIGAGELLPGVRQYIQAFGLEKKVTLHGSQPNEIVIESMRSADMFLQHSIRAVETGDEEGLPVAILEAMAQALPIVSTHHAGISEAVVEGVTGYLVEEGDSAAMGERIVALSQNADLRRKMGIAGWERAGSHYSWSKEKQDLIQVLGLQ